MSMREYKEVTLPVGTFRMYSDRPDIWVQVSYGPDVVDRINFAYYSGSLEEK